jgi:hypothetical protein
MDCAELRRLLVTRAQTGAGLGALGADAEAHAAGCAACRFLVEQGGALPALMAGAKEPGPSPADFRLLAELERGVRADQAAERGPVAWLRAQSRAFRVSLLLGAAGLQATLVYWQQARADLSTYPGWRLAASLAVFAVVALVAAWQAFRPLYLPPPPRWLGPVVFGAAASALAVFTVILPEVATRPECQVGYHQLYWAHYCFASGMVQGGVVLLLAGLLSRGRGGGATPWLAAAGAGLAGNIGLQLHCAVNFPVHLMLGHATVPFGFLLLFGFVRRRA